MKLKEYLVRYKIDREATFGVAVVVASSINNAVDILKTQGSYNGSENSYLITEVILINDTDSYTSAAILEEIATSSGYSAYEIAKLKGFKGTSKEWLDSLVGEPGPVGDKGDKGDPGKSAYEIAVQEGYEGTAEEYYRLIKESLDLTTTVRANTSDIDKLQRSIAGGVHFRGVVTELPWEQPIFIGNEVHDDMSKEDLRAALNGYEVGDIIIVASTVWDEMDGPIPDSEQIPAVEYILVEEHDSSFSSQDSGYRYRWEDLGDCSVSDQKIATLEESFSKHVKEYKDYVDQAVQNAGNGSYTLRTIDLYTILGNLDPNHPYGGVEIEFIGEPEIDELVEAIKNKKQIFLQDSLQEQHSEGMLMVADHIQAYLDPASGVLGVKLSFMYHLSKIIIYTFDRSWYVTLYIGADVIKTVGAVGTHFDLNSSDIIKTEYDSSIVAQKLLLNVTESLEGETTHGFLATAKATQFYVDKMAEYVDVTKQEYSAEAKKQIAANIGTEKASNTLVKRSENGNIYAPLIQDDQGLMLAYSSSGNEYKLEADEILLTERVADSRYAKKGEGGSITGDGSKKWKLVVDRRMEVGEQNVDFTTFADGTPLQAEEAVVQVIVDGVADSLTGYIAINSTTNKTDSLYGVIYYNAQQVTGEGTTFVNHIEFKASPFVMIPKLTSGKVAIAVGGGFTGPAGSVASPQVYEDIVAIKLRPNAKITEAPPIIKIYAR